jgi:hypothetical protein
MLISNDVTGHQNQAFKAPLDRPPSSSTKKSRAILYNKSSKKNQINMSDNQQPSSGSSLANSAEGNVRQGVAKVTGNPHDQAAADEKKSIFHPHRSNLTW